MMNELYQLSEALEIVGKRPGIWHKDLKQLPNASAKNPCYKIIVNKDGTISGIEPLIDVSFLKKWQFGSNGYSFPGFSIKPLYTLTGNDDIKTHEKWSKGKEQINAKILLEWCTEENKTAWNNKMINNSLWKVPQELVKILNEIPKEFIGVQYLFERIFQHWGENGSNILFNQMNAFLHKKAEENTDLAMLLRLLVNPKTDNISIFFDVPDFTDYPVAHEKTISWINEKLLNQSNNKLSVGSSQNRYDAFGAECIGNEGVLADVKLPYIGNVKLRAMSHESPCQFRYGTIDAYSFPIGKYYRDKVKSALEWLGDPIRKGETWGRADESELIFAYPAVLAEPPLKLAACFGAKKTDDTIDRFENYASEVIKNLYGLASPLKEIELRVFSLRKMGKKSSKTKVVFHRNYTAQRLVDAANEWQLGCSNIPNIVIKTWDKIKGEVVETVPATPFPLQVADCLNRVWKIDSKKNVLIADVVKIVPYTIGIDLLLEISPSFNRVPYLLSIALQNSNRLFCYIGDKRYRGNSGAMKSDIYKELMPPIVGLLLWKLSIKKENYMNNPPYLIGQILKVADNLHALYCKELRKGKLPPQLLGNALMAAALESPTQALAQLALRIVPYIGWAKTNSTPSAGLSRYLLKEFGQIEEKMRNETFPVRFDDASKAQLLLGYIANNSQVENNNN